MRIGRLICAASLSLWTVAACTLAASSASAQQTLNYTVDSLSQPWQFVNGGLNTGFQFGTSDGLAPTIVSAADGYDFTPGGSFTVTYVSGLTTAFNGIPPYADANGDITYDASNHGGSSGTFFPSLYVNPASYPVFLNALIGTFADGSGAIVGTPFLVGNGPTTEIVPVGATRLQFGINDDIFADNAGSLLVSVFGPIPAAVPEPGTLALFATSALTGAAFLRRRKHSR